MSTPMMACHIQLLLLIKYELTINTRFFHSRLNEQTNRYNGYLIRLQHKHNHLGYIEMYRPVSNFNMQKNFLFDSPPYWIVYLLCNGSSGYWYLDILIHLLLIKNLSEKTPVQVTSDYLFWWRRWLTWLCDFYSYREQFVRWWRHDRLKIFQLESET